VGIEYALLKLQISPKDAEMCCVLNTCEETFIMLNMSSVLKSLKSSSLWATFAKG
jgi:hypothetical protein